MQPCCGTSIGKPQHGVVLVPVIAEHRCGVEYPTTRVHVEAVLHQQRIGQQPYHPPISIAEWVNPTETVVRQGDLHQRVIISKRENHYLENFRFSPCKHWPKPDRQLAII